MTHKRLKENPSTHIVRKFEILQFVDQRASVKPKCWGLKPKSQRNSNCQFASKRFLKLLGITALLMMCHYSLAYLTLCKILVKGHITIVQRGRKKTLLSVPIECRIFITACSHTHPCLLPPPLESALSQMASNVVFTTPLSVQRQASNGSQVAGRHMCLWSDTSFARNCFGRAKQHPWPSMFVFLFK